MNLRAKVFATIATIMVAMPIAAYIYTWFIPVWVESENKDYPLGSLILLLFSLALSAVVIGFLIGWALKATYSAVYSRFNRNRKASR